MNILFAQVILIASLIVPTGGVPPYDPDTERARHYIAFDGGLGGAYDHYTAALSEGECTTYPGGSPDPFGGWGGEGIWTSGCTSLRPRYDPPKLGGGSGYGYTFSRKSQRWDRPAVSGSKDPFGGWGGLGEWWGNGIYEFPSQREKARSHHSLGPLVSR